MSNNDDSFDLEKCTYKQSVNDLWHTFTHYLSIFHTVLLTITYSSSDFITVTHKSMFRLTVIRVYSFERWHSSCKYFDKTSVLLSIIFNRLLLDKCKSVCSPAYVGPLPHGRHRPSLAAGIFVRKRPRHLRRGINHNKTRLSRKRQDSVILTKLSTHLGYITVHVVEKNQWVKMSKNHETENCKNPKDGKK